MLSGCPSATESSLNTSYGASVDRYMDISSTDSYHTVYSLLQLTFGKQSDVIVFEDFKEFLFQWANYFKESDLDLFLRDVEIGLKLEGDRVSIGQISSMIEYDSECFPR